MRRKDDAQARQAQVPDKDLNQQGRTPDERDVKARHAVGNGVCGQTPQGAEQSQDDGQHDGQR